MARKLARTGIVTMVLAGAVMAGGGLPAVAQDRPGVGFGTEVVVTYYNNAQHTTEVGQHAFGSCGLYTTGSTSNFTSVNEYMCPS
jgi:hypothetical protein